MLEKKFKIKSVGKTSAMFDAQKCAWLNAEHIKALADKDFLETFRNFVEKDKCLPENSTLQYAETVALLFKERMTP